MEWFGPSWGGHLCDPAEHTDTPVGEDCLACDEPIEDGDQGILAPCLEAPRGTTEELERLIGQAVENLVNKIGGAALNVLDTRPIHYECHMRQVLGGVNHQDGNCYCQGGTMEPDPPGLSAREAARAALAHWEKPKGFHH